MPPTILPPSNKPFTGAGATAEQKALDFLKALPDTYYVLLELRTHPTLEKRRAGSTEDRLDLVIIGPAIGAIVFEVKDWNIQRNLYEWVDQYSVHKTDEYRNVECLRNPFAQVDEYYRAVYEILASQYGQDSVRVSGFVVYPRLTRAEFENAFLNGESSRANPQKKYLIDMGRTIFGDMLDRYWDNPLAFLSKLVESHIKQPYDSVHINKTVDALIPPKIRVGDPSIHERGYEHLLLMDKRQQEWAFSDEIAGKNYILDVAGSGKTNVILSRAMHLADRHESVTGFLMLILTYSEALARDLRRILAIKIKDATSIEAERYGRTIVIDHIEHLMEQILDADLGKESADRWRQQVKTGLAPPDDYLEYALPERCQDILDGHSERFRIYNYLLVDEVQDFSDFFLDVAMCLLKDRKKVFMVGDTGQKLFFQRKHNLLDLGLVEERMRVPGHYRMYRSPKFIAQLAWSFLHLDHFIAHELREEGYEDTIKPQNTMVTQPVFKYCQTREALIEQVYDDVANLLAVRGRPEQVLCIGLPDTLSILSSRFAASSFPVCWAREIPLEERKIVLADFTQSKGLERDYVFVLDADRLPDGRLTSENQFLDQEHIEEECRLSRMKIFVAFTRAIREVTFYYVNRSCGFITELLELDRSRLR